MKNSNDSALQEGNGREFCTTSEAARILGVSNTTVQMMLERGDLEGWRTRGGHRRIVRSSIERIRGHAHGASGDTDTDVGREFSIVVVEDDSGLRALYEHKIADWRLPASIRSVSDGLEALLLIERARPDLLVLDLVMRPMDGFQLLRLLRSHPEFNRMLIVAVTGLTEDEVRERGGLPKGVVLFHKPVPFDRLHGLVEAAVASRSLEAP